MQKCQHIKQHQLCKGEIELCNTENLRFLWKYVIYRQPVWAFNCTNEIAMLLCNTNCWRYPAYLEQRCYEIRWKTGLLCLIHTFSGRKAHYLSELKQQNSINIVNNFTNSLSSSYISLPCKELFFNKIALYHISTGLF